MKCFLISYDLQREDENCERLIRRLMDLGAFAILPRQWALKAPLTSAALRDDLSSYIDPSDRLLVAPITSCAYQRRINADKLNEIVA